MTELEKSLKISTSEWALKCDILKTELAELTKSLQEMCSLKESVTAQFLESERACESMKEDLKVTRETCASLEDVKQQNLHELENLTMQLMKTQEEVEMQRADKERGLEKAEVNVTF